jgi:hypothetical protein
MKTQIVKANTLDEAKKICPWAIKFQRTEDYKTTNNWICSTL